MDSLGHNTYFESIGRTCNYPGYSVTALARKCARPIPRGTLLKSDLASLRSVVLSGYRPSLTSDSGVFLTNLQGIEYLTGLRSLRFGEYVYVNSLDPLSKMTQLEELQLPNHNSSDLKFLPGLTNLTSLIADYQWRAPNYEPLADLIKLKFLSLKGYSPGGVRDSAIAKLTNLVRLDLESGAPPNLSVLRPLYRLEHLNLGRTFIENISPLVAFTNLTEIDLRYAKISDLSPLRDLGSLRVLKLLRNEVFDLLLIGIWFRSDLF